MLNSFDKSDMIIYLVWIVTCLNCSSKVQDPPRSLLPVDWGVGGWEGRAPWLGKLERPARNWGAAPAWRRRASRAGRPCRASRGAPGRPSLGTGCSGSRSDRIPMVGLPVSSVSTSLWSSEVSLFPMSLWQSCLRSVPLSPGDSAPSSDTPLRGDWN